MTKRKPKLGRPPLGKDARTTVIAVKFSANELAAIRAAAGEEPLSSWIRERALAPINLD